MPSLDPGVSLRVGALVAALTATACIHDPKPRPFGRDESIELSAVSLRVPGEDGWRGWIFEGRGRREVVLRHDAVDGTPARGAVVVETPAWPWSLAPGGASARFSVEAVGSSSDAGGHGPLAATSTYRVVPAAPAGGAAPLPAATYRRLTFTPTFRLDRSYQAAYWERDADAGPPAGFDERAQAFLAGVRPRPPVPGAPVTPTASDWSAGTSVGVAAGGGIASLRGERLVGSAVRVCGGIFSRATASGVGLGYDVAVLVFSGQNDDFNGAVSSLSPGAFVIWRALRAGVGLDVGYAGLVPLGSRRVTHGFVIGPRAWVSADLVRLPAGRLFVEVGGAITTPRFLEASASLGWRVE